MKNLRWLTLGIFIGVAGCGLFYRLFLFKEKRYFELQSNYRIESQGTLKQGTLLQYDHGYPEGFTRYILYLNLKDPNVKERMSEQKDEVVPYWLERD
jgi:hypothetical protein